MDIPTTIKNNWALHPKPIREQQEKILYEILEGMKKGYKYFIIHAGTGIGKSAISTTLTQVSKRKNEKSYILTPFIQLQEQYMNDFPRMLKDIKGKHHYKCNNGGDCSKCYCKMYVNKKNKLSEKRRILSLNPKWKWHNTISTEKYDEILSDLKVYCHDCEYKLAKKEAIQSSVMLTNYHYLYGLGNYAHQIHPRKLLICDEAHNLETIISGMLTRTLNRTDIYYEFGFDIFYDIDFGNYITLNTTEYWTNIFNRLIDIITNEKNQQKSLLKELDIPDDVIEDELKEYSNKINKYEHHKKLIQEEENFIINLPTLEEITADEDIEKELKVTLEPIMISNYADNLLKYGEIVILLSATLPSKKDYCNDLGLKPNEVKLIKAESPFPSENRPIVFKNIRENNYYRWEHEDNIKAIKNILKDHCGEKGIIHTTSDKQCHWLYENLKDTIKCFVVARQNGREYNRAYIINSFKNYDGAALCIGARIKEGVDFEGDNGRFQIMLNVPYSPPNEKLKKRSKIDPNWQYRELVIKLEQAYGRIIRNENDYGVFYILDKRIKNVMKYNGRLLSRYFKQGVREGKRFDINNWVW